MISSASIVSCETTDHEEPWKYKEDDWEQSEKYPKDMEHISTSETSWTVDEEDSCETAESQEEEERKECVNSYFWVVEVIFCLI